MRTIISTPSVIPALLVIPAKAGIQSVGTGEQT